MDIKSLPKKPLDALEKLSRDLLDAIPVTNNKLSSFNLSKIGEIKTLARMANIAANRVDDQMVREIAQTNLAFSEGQSASAYRSDIETILDAIIGSKFDRHFLDAVDVEDFDNAELSEEEKTEIRGLMAQARLLTEAASFLSDDHKRRIVHRISDVENELYKENAGFKSFLAAAADVSTLVSKFGTDAQPLANAIQSARTITERKVEGYKQLEEEEKPRQIEGPKE